MDSGDLDRLIDELQYAFPSEGPRWFQGRVDWQPLFETAKRIQAGFSGGVHYPTKSARDVAWTRFNDLRNKLHERANADRHDFRMKSASLRNELLDLLKFAHWSLASDAFWNIATLGLLSTTAEDIKRKGETVREAGQRLSRYKGDMLKEHKDECFERILEVRQSHDAFWGEYRAQIAKERQDRSERRDEIRNRISANIAANKERLAKAAAAYERVEANIEENVARLASARSDDYRERVMGWIEEGREKLRSIQDSIDRIESWIAEDRDRLGSFESRL